MFGDIVLELRYRSELGVLHPGGRLRRRMMGNARYTFGIIAGRMGETYAVDRGAMASASSPEGLIEGLGATGPEDYAHSMDRYNRWIAAGEARATDVVLTSGTSGSPKIVTYSSHDSARDMLVIARGLRLSYPGLDLRSFVFLLELATAYPAASPR